MSRSQLKDFLNATSTQWSTSLAVIKLFLGDFASVIKFNKLPFVFEIAFRRWQWRTGEKILVRGNEKFCI